MAKDAEAMSATDAAKHPNRHRSEPNVPNGSRSRSSIAGRRPLLDDDQLLQLAAQLHARKGDVPKLDELIDASGGCQRQRASRALKQLRAELASKAVRAAITLPLEHEQALRAWTATWLDIASKQLAEEHATLSEKHQAEIDRLQDLIAEQRAHIAMLREQAEDQHRIACEYLETQESQAAEIERLKGELLRVSAIADERRRMLERSSGSGEPSFDAVSC